jgi:hypothetical protein
MKRHFKACAICAFLITSVACSPLYNTAKSYDESHFTAFQEIIDHAGTPAGTVISYTEAADLNLIGKMMETPVPYHRVDTVRYKGFTSGENFQCRVPSGLAVLFKTNSSVIKVKTQWGQLYSAVNTMGVAYRGYDLYIKDPSGEWIWAGSGATKPEKAEDPVTLVTDMDGSVHECMLYLPNYCEVYSCKIGIDEKAEIAPLENTFRHRIVFHGSSYTHGISTSRSGMSYPMQFMRHTGMQVIPFGMSGNCMMQPYMADVLKDVEADAYVFDAFSNPNYKMIAERLIPFIDALIAAHPGKPMIFQQTIYREARNFNRVYEAREQAKQDMASNMFAEILKNPKYKDVYFIQTNASSMHESSVDGVHPDDYGYYLWSKSIEKPILKILAKYGIK